MLGNLILGDVVPLPYGKIWGILSIEEFCGEKRKIYLGRYRQGSLGRGSAPTCENDEIGCAILHSLTLIFVWLQVCQVTLSSLILHLVV